MARKAPAFGYFFLSVYIKGVEWEKFGNWGSEPHHRTEKRK